MHPIYQNGATARPSALFGWYSFMNRKAENNYPNPTDQIIYNGITYLETTYTLLHGWLTDTSMSENLEQSTAAMPNIFDTAVILDILTDCEISLSPVILNRAKCWLLDEKIKEDNVWNFFSRHCQVIPPELDTTSNVICCLYGLQGIGKPEARDLAENMLNRMWIHQETGIADVYFKLEHMSGNWPTWKVKKRVDIGVIANLLYCLARLGMDELLNGERLNPCFNLIDNFLSGMLSGGKGSLYLKNYESCDIALFFISRLVRWSEKGKEMFGRMMEMLIRYRFGQDSIALHISCRILAVVNLGIKEDWWKELVVREARVLIGLRNLEDYSWPMTTFYNAHKSVYFGSKAVSTGFAVAAIQKVGVIAENLGEGSGMGEDVGMVSGRH